MAKGKDETMTDGAMGLALGQGRTLDTLPMKDIMIHTRGIDGDTRHWGICDTCGHVEELSDMRVVIWQMRPTCEVCQDDAVRQAEEARAMLGMGNPDLI